MKDEIKDILLKLQILKNTKEIDEYHIDKEDGVRLLNYITNLQKENNNLKEDFKRHIDRINELTERSDNLQEENEILKDNLETMTFTAK